MDKKCSCSIPFNGTEEQKQKLMEVISTHKNQEGALMPVMQEAQEIYGYLPIEVQTMVAEGLDVPLEKVYGICTFYSQFSLQPKGKYEISICLGTACYVKGSGEIYDKFCQLLNIKDGECTPDGLFSLTACRCLGACGLAPVLTVNGEVYGKVKMEDVEPLLAKYREMN